MNKCDKYHTLDRLKYTYNPLTGAPVAHTVTVGVCWGTKEQEECTCDGNCANCDFYPEVRTRVKRSMSASELCDQITEVVLMLNNITVKSKDKQLMADATNKLINIRADLLAHVD